MRLKTSLQVSAIFPVTLAIVVSLCLYMRSRSVETAQSGIYIASDATILISDLHSATFSFLLNNDDASSEEWFKKYKALDAFLADKHFSDLRLNMALENLKDNLQIVKSNLVKINDELRRMVKNGWTEGKARSKEYKALEAELSESLKEMQKNAIDLAKKSNQSAMFAAQNADTYFMVFVGILALVMAYSTIKASKGIVARMKELKTSTDKVSEGKFERATFSGDNDELGQLFRSFNKMISTLKNTVTELKTDSQSSKVESLKMKNAAEAARQSQMKLADAMTRLQRAQEQIIQKERVHALEQIGSGVVRDFQAALTPITSTVDFLLSYPDHMKNHDELVEHMHTIGTAAKETQKQLSRLSEVFFSHANTKGQAIEINSLVEKAIRLTESYWKPISETHGSITIDAELEDIPLVQGLEAEFTEAISNLIINSVDAMPKGGTIKITTRRNKDKIILSVSDNGTGMSDEVQQRAIEPFFSTKASSNSGMGLTNVMTAATRFGGTLDINSNEKEGATISLNLPLFKQKFTSHSDDAKTHKKKLPDKLGILVIDDDKWIRNILTKALATEGHDIDTAECGKEGLEKSEKYEYDIVIVDMAMPDIDGETVAKQIKENHPDCPIIMITGFGHLMKQQGQKPDNVDYLLSKPLMIADLKQVIIEAMNQTG